ADASGTKNLRASFDLVLSTGKPHRMPIQHYDVPKPEGGFEEKYWSPVNTPVINAQGNVEYIIHRILDVTEVMKKQDVVKGLTNRTEMLKNSLDEIKQQAEQLKESRALLQSVFDASPNSIILSKIVYDSAEKVEDFEFSMINAQAFQLIGLRENIIGKRLSREFPTVITTGIYDQLKITAETGDPTSFEAWYEGEGIQKSFHW